MTLDAVTRTRSQNSAPRRFLAHVNKDGPLPDSRPDLGPCWLWTGAIQSEGYGMIRIDDRAVYAHRLSVEISRGDVPIGMDVDHLCRNRGCVNPDHLEAVSHATNIRRGARSALAPNCPQGHAFDAANTYINAKGHRQCRACWKRWRS